MIDTCGTCASEQVNMGRETVIAAVALLCVGLAVLDVHGVEGRMVPSRMLYARMPWCTGARGEIPGITCIRPVANTEMPPASYNTEAARTEDEDCQAKHGHLPPIHCQDPPKH